MVVACVCKCSGCGRVRVEFVWGSMGGDYNREMRLGSDTTGSAKRRYIRGRLDFPGCVGDKLVNKNLNTYDSLLNLLSHLLM